MKALEGRMRWRLRPLALGTAALTAIVSCQMLAGLEDRRTGSGDAAGQAGVSGGDGSDGEGGASGPAEGTGAVSGNTGQMTGGSSSEPGVAGEANEGRAGATAIESGGAPAQGGLLIAFSPTGNFGEACISGSSMTTFGVGNPPPAADGSSNGLPITSGEDEIDVTCTVSKDGSFRATIAAPNVSLDLSGTVGQLAAISAYAPSATLHVIGVDICTLDTTPPYEYDAGEMFIGFSCTRAMNPDVVGMACSVSGSVVVRRCAE